MPTPSQLLARIERLKYLMRLANVMAMHRGRVTPGAAGIARRRLARIRLLQANYNRRLHRSGMRSLTSRMAALTLSPNSPMNLRMASPPNSPMNMNTHKRKRSSSPNTLPRTRARR